MVAPDCPGPRWTDPAAERLVLALLDRIAERLGTAPARVVVIGYSMGGIGAWHFAATHPERFSAAISMAGRPGTALPTIPIYIVHSRRDEVIAIGPDEAAVAALKAAGVPVVFKVLDEPTHYAVEDHAVGLDGVVPWLEQHWMSRP